MNIRKSGLLPLLLAGLSVAPAFGGFLDYRVTIDTTVHSFGVGGEFQITSLNTGQLGQFLPGASDFRTFCVETDDFFVPGTTYDAEIATSTMRFPPNNADPVIRELTNATAWLYSEFRAGTLAGYRFGGSTAERKADAGELQNAIWSFMGQLAAPSGNAFYDAAINQFGTLANGLLTDDIGNVRVLRLFSHNSPLASHQDQLMMLPVAIPAPGAAVLALVGIVGLVGWTKRT